MHGLLPAKFTRRIGPLAAAVVLPALVGPALVGAALFGLASPVRASPAHEARASGVSVAIDSMNPQVAGPGTTVSATGTVTNGTSQTVAGLEVQLTTSSARFQSRDAMDAYLSHGLGANLGAVGNPFFITTGLRPGATAVWHASFGVDSAGIAEFGVYPVTAQLGDQQGNVLATDQTLLPFWPGQRAAGLLHPLDISWIWPLIDQPHVQACGALTNNDLAASLGPQGRLYGLLAAGQAHADAKLTWVIDPALLGDAETMTRPYRVGSGSGCEDSTPSTPSTPGPASRAATAWLSRLRAVTSSGQPTVITPYANVDASALVHSGLTTDLANAYATGSQVADSVLHGSFRPSVAVPAGGTANLSLLTSLAATEHIDTVVLDSSEMPPLSSTVFEDDAVTSITGAGTTMTVMLADHVLTGVLQAGNTSTGVLSPSTHFAVGQRFLAETAMIAAEAPDSERSIVVSPPDGWSPSAALASQLLTETVRAPWLAPTRLGALAQAPDTARSIKRQLPPSSTPSPAELSGGYLYTIGMVGKSLDVYQAMLYQPSKGYQQSLGEALAATESSAWRGGGIPQGIALANGLSAYLTNEEKKVKIIASDQVSMAGASGAVPLNIQNGMSRAIRVKVIVSVVSSPDLTSQLTVGRFQDVVVVQPQLSPLVRLPVSSAPQGSTVIKLSLATADGRPLRSVATKSLTVLSTRYGRDILFLIGAAIGVMILTSVYRGVRRWLRAESHVTGEDAGQPGSVGTGTSARHPMEAPDDLAEARRRADDP